MLEAIAALLLVAIGFLMGVHSAGLASLPPHKRPRYAHRLWYRLLWSPARFVLIGTGLALAGAVSIVLFAAFAAALAVAWARRTYVKTGRYQKRMLRRAFVDLCKQDPTVDREDLLLFMIQSRHPRWDPEMIGQMVRDHPTVDALLESLIRLERQVFE